VKTGPLFFARCWPFIGAWAKDRFGLSVALSTPFTKDRAIDLPRLVAHARQSLADSDRRRAAISGRLNPTSYSRCSTASRSRASMDVVLGCHVTASVKALVGLRRNDPVA